MQDKGGRNQWSQYSLASGSSSGAAGSSSSAAGKSPAAAASSSSPSASGSSSSHPFTEPKYQGGDTSLPGPHLLRPWLLNNASNKSNITKHKLPQPQPQSSRSNANPHRTTTTLLLLRLPQFLMHLPQP
jgi:signal transducing adaptor molecule